MTESSSPAASGSSTHVTTGLATGSFWGLMVTQFLGATNDNIFRWLIINVGSNIAGKGHEAEPVTIGTVLFVVPYILFASPAGFLSNRFGKRAVIVGCKVAEVLLMLLGIAAILMGNLNFMYGLIFLMGTHSAIFGPAKYGVLPEIVRTDRLSAANGLMAMSTIIAIVLGTVLGNFLISQTGLRGQDHWWISAVTLIGVAAAGLAGSLIIAPTTAANPHARFPWNLARETYRDLAALGGQRPLLWAALASALFWSVASLVQNNVFLYAKNFLVVSPQYVGPILAVTCVGVAAGNVLAGRWSKGRIELGIVFVGCWALPWATCCSPRFPSPSSWRRWITIPAPVGQLFVVGRLVAAPGAGGGNV